MSTLIAPKLCPASRNREEIHLIVGIFLFRNELCVEDLNPCIQNQNKSDQQ